MDLLILEPGHYEDPANPGFCPAYSSFRGGRPARLSGDIWVNRHGRRFIPEDSTDADLQERVIQEQPGAVMWVIFDEAMRKGLTPEIGAWTEREIRSSLVSATTIPELATKLGIDPDGLVETVEAYNRGIAGGEDPLGRVARPKPLDEAPFYGCRCDGTIVLTFGGIAIDERLRVKRGDGQSFRNLYAAGEVIGGAQVMGNGFASGMSAGPALTLGRQAARFALGTA
jgi:fumarate reductase flavoprotein subunit